MTPNVVVTGARVTLVVKSDDRFRASGTPKCWAA